MVSLTVASAGPSRLLPHHIELPRTQPNSDTFLWEVSQVSKVSRVGKVSKVSRVSKVRRAIRPGSFKSCKQQGLYADLAPPPSMCYKSVTRVFKSIQECYKSVTRVLQECYKSVTS
jgi:hypothetical protein